MKVLLDTSENRAVKGLNTLYSIEKWWTEKELSVVLGCSPDTTYRTIDKLKLFAREENQCFEIVTQKNRGIFLSIDSNYTIREIESLYFSKTLGYKMLNLIIQSRDMTIDGLCTSLAISSSTLYRKLKKIELFLKHNSIHFNMSTLKISGEEHLIREFFYRMYWSVVKSNDWPFKNVLLADLEKDYETKMMVMKLNLTTIEKHQFFYRLAIIHLRNQSRFFLESSAEIQLIAPLHTLYVAEVEAFMPDSTPEAYRLIEATFLVYVLVYNPLFEEPFGDDQRQVVWHHFKGSPAYDMAHRLFKQLTKTLPNLRIHSQTKLRYKLLCASLHVELHKALVVNDHDNQVLLHNFSLEHPYLYKTMDDYLEKELINRFGNLTKVGHDFMMLTMLLILYDTTNIASLKKEIMVKISCFIEPQSETYLKELINKRFHQNIVVQTSLHGENLGRTYDLYLSDFRTIEADTIKATHRYVWDFPPTDRDWTNIEAIIASVYERLN